MHTKAKNVISAVVSSRNSFTTQCTSQSDKRIEWRVQNTLAEGVISWRKCFGQESAIGLLAPIEKTFFCSCSFTVHASLLFLEAVREELRRESSKYRALCPDVHFAQFGQYIPPRKPTAQHFCRN